MSKYLNSLVVGIDVASEFSFSAVIVPDGSKYRKPFKIFHTAEGFKYFIEPIKKAKVKLIESVKNAKFVSLTSPWLFVSITTSIPFYVAIDAKVATLIKKLKSS